MYRKRAAVMIILFIDSSFTLLFSFAQSNEKDQVLPPSRQTPERLAKRSGISLQDAMGHCGGCMGSIRWE